MSFDVSSSSYDDHIRKTIPFYDTLHDQAIDMVKAVKPHVKVWLDTGCGTGTLIEKALPQFKDTFFILADPSYEMLTTAKARLKSVSMNHVRYLAIAGTESLTLDVSRRPEVITAIQSHHYFGPEGRLKATKNCWDLLSNDGLYITFENIMPNSREGIEIGLQRWTSFQIVQGKKPKESEEHKKRFNTKYYPIKTS